MSSPSSVFVFLKPAYFKNLAMKNCVSIAAKKPLQTSQEEGSFVAPLKQPQPHPSFYKYLM